MPAVRKATGVETLDPTLLTAAEKLEFEGFQRREKTNHVVRRMAGEGVPIKRIERLAGLSRGLVRQTIRAEREGRFSHLREQPDRLVAATGAGVEQRMPQRRRTLAPATD